MRRNILKRKADEINYGSAREDNSVDNSKNAKTLYKNQSSRLYSQSTKTIYLPVHMRQCEFSPPEINSERAPTGFKGSRTKVRFLATRGDSVKAEDEYQE